MDKAHLATDKRLARMEAHLSDVYAAAGKDVQRKADEYFSKFEAADEKKRALVAQGKLDEGEYKSWRKNKLMYGKRFSQMKQQIAAEYANVNKTALAYINGELPDIYALNYNVLASDVDGVGGYSFALTDADTVRYLATTDNSLLPKKTLDIPKDMAWSTKKINAEVLQGIIQGEKVTDIAKRLENVTGMEKNAAIRNARTMVTGAQNKGRLDSYARAEADGIILKKEWIATNDGRVRHWHAALDGQQRDQDKPFDSEYGKIMYPGDPAAHPANVYNCRCSLGGVVVGFKKVNSAKNTSLSPLTSAPGSGIIKLLDDIQIGRSVGAKAQNYSVMDLDTGEYFRFVEGTKIQNPEVFAGKGTNKELKIAEKYADKYGGLPEEWQHVKGFGLLETDDGDRRAEVHWMQCEGVGKHDFFIKEWID